MGLSQQQAIQLYGTERYTGWGEEEARQDAQAKGISAGSGSSGGDDFASIFGMSLQQYLDSVNGSADKLLEIAKGDYNLVAKWIENDYTQATGTDDQAKKDLLLKVSNDLEKRIGTLAFDYETGTYRTKEDMGLTETNTNTDRNLALKRLSEDDAVYKKQVQTQAVNDRTATAQSLNSRGLLSGKYDENTGETNVTGIGSKNIGQLEQGITDKFDALQRATDRGKDDINLYADRTIAQSQLTGNRNLQDLTTGVRRGLQGANDARQKALDEAEAKRKAEELRIEQERAKNKALANSYAYNQTAPY